MNKVKMILAGVHWANLLAAAAQVLQIFPPKPWVLFFQAGLAAVLPSLHGVGHTVAFGGPQTRD